MATAPQAAENVLQACLKAALKAVDPLHCLPPALRSAFPQPPTGRILVLGAGKAAARMARALEESWPDVTFEGLVVTRYEHGDVCKRIELVEAAHPVPDAAGQRAAERILALAQSARAGDTVIALISGGGSSLLTLPAPGISLAEKQRINKALLASGAPIDQMNTVRSFLSSIKGGRLGAACGAATVHSFVLSDVPGDDPAVVASGPTIARDCTAADALSILKHYSIEIPRDTREIIEKTVLPVSNSLGPRHVHVIATANHALAAAQAVGEASGWQVTNLGAYIEGEAREVGRVHAGIARELADVAARTAKPQLLISGGETTVTVKHPNPGRGGRNGEFLLSAMLANTVPNLHALAVDTDGIDGVESNAGAQFSPQTLAQIGKAKAHEHLQRNDAFTCFELGGGLITTGPTRTNVNDFRAFAISV